MDEETDVWGGPWVIQLKGKDGIRTPVLPLLRHGQGVRALMLWPGFRLQCSWGSFPWLGRRDRSMGLERDLMKALKC